MSDLLDCLKVKKAPCSAKRPAKYLPVFRAQRAFRLNSSQPLSKLLEVQKFETLQEQLGAVGGWVEREVQNSLRRCRSNWVL
jgi:hypothetical protein